MGQAGGLPLQAVQRGLEQGTRGGEGWRVLIAGARGGREGYRVQGGASGGVGCATLPTGALPLPLRRSPGSSHRLNPLVHVPVEEPHPFHYPVAGAVGSVGNPWVVQVGWSGRRHQVGLRISVEPGCPRHGTVHSPWWCTETNEGIRSAESPPCPRWPRPGAGTGPR